MTSLRRQLQSNERVAGWAFVALPLAGLLAFLLVPIGLALYVSFTDWNGFSPPLQSQLVGADNYRELLIEPGLRRTDLATALRNNLYYVLGVVPAQTMLAFVIAVILNQRVLKGRGFFRSAYYFPSISGSIAVALIFVFLFQGSGAINRLIPWRDVNWLENANGLLHNAYFALGFDTPPGVLTEHAVLGLSWWQWLAGPSVTLLAIMLLNTWTTTGTMMLIFLAGLQNIPTEIEEATAIDGASPVQRFVRVTVPMMKPTLFFVLTIGLIGTWQVFDQIYVVSAGGPQKTTMTPAFMVYTEGFENSRMGSATAVAFILFVIIIVLTMIQRRVVNPSEQ